MRYAPKAFRQAVAALYRRLRQRRRPQPAFRAVARLTDLLAAHGHSHAQIRAVLQAVDQVVQEAVAADRQRSADIARHFRLGSDAANAIANRRPQ